MDETAQANAPAPAEPREPADPIVAVRRPEAEAEASIAQPTLRLPDPDGPPPPVVAHGASGPETAETVAAPEAVSPASGAPSPEPAEAAPAAPELLPRPTQAPPDLATVEPASAEPGAVELAEGREPYPFAERIEALEHFQEYFEGLSRERSEGHASGETGQVDAGRHAAEQLAEGAESAVATSVLPGDVATEAPEDVATDRDIATRVEAAHPAGVENEGSRPAAPDAAVPPGSTEQPELEIERGARPGVPSPLGQAREGSQTLEVGATPSPFPPPAWLEPMPPEPGDGQTHAVPAATVSVAVEHPQPMEALPRSGLGLPQDVPLRLRDTAEAGAAPSRNRLFPSRTLEARGASDARLPSPSESAQQALPYLRRALWGAGAVTVGLAVTVLVLAVAYRWINPPISTLMLGQSIAGTTIERTWVPIERISPNLIRAVVLSEDAGFCRHRGVDWGAIEEALGSDRGGSTITMQVVKNLFLWPSRSYVRKAIEMGLAYLVEALWPKRRIIEIYLNVAEWGDGVFGAEAAARAHFDKRASRLTAQEAALLAVALPNPIDRTPAAPSLGTGRLASRLMLRMATSRADLSCLPVPSAPSRKAPAKAPLVPGPRLTL